MDPTTDMLSLEDFRHNTSGSVPMILPRFYNLLVKRTTGAVVTEIYKCCCQHCCPICQRITCFIQNILEEVAILQYRLYIKFSRRLKMPGKMVLIQRELRTFITSFEARNVSLEPSRCIRHWHFGASMRQSFNSFDVESLVNNFLGLSNHTIPNRHWHAPQPALFVPPTGLALLRVR